MKAKLSVALVIILLMFQTFSFASAIPDIKNLKPTQLTSTLTRFQNDPMKSTLGTVIREGSLVELTDETELLPGDIINYSFYDQMTLTFWNVGEAGTTEGSLAYSEVTLTHTFVQATAGEMIKGLVKTPQMKKGYTVEKFSNPNELITLNRHLATMTFSGGYDGTFRGAGDFMFPPNELKKVKYSGELAQYGNVANIRFPNPDGSESELTFIIPMGMAAFGITEEMVKEMQKGETVEYSGGSPAGLTGQVEWSPTGEPGTWTLLQMGTKLPVNAHIKTQEDSSCIISFTDMSTFVMKEESHIVLTMPPDYKQSKIKMVAGNVWVNVKKMLKDGSMEVEMNQGVSGIKGTTFVLTEAEGKSTLRLIEGSVDFTSLADQKTTSLQGGQYISASAEGTVEEGSFDALAEQEQWNAAAGSELIDKELIQGKKGLNGSMILYAGLACFGVIVLIVVLKMKKK